MSVNLDDWDEDREVAPLKPSRTRKRKRKNAVDPSSSVDASRDSKSTEKETGGSNWKIILLVVLSIVMAFLAWNVAYYRPQQRGAEPVHTTHQEPVGHTDTLEPSKSPIPRKRKASEHCKTPIFEAQEVYDRLKSHITKPEEFAICLKLQSAVVSDIIKGHDEDRALEAVISKWAEDEKRACWDNIVRALGCMKKTGLAVQIAVEYGFGPNQ